MFNPSKQAANAFLIQFNSAVPQQVLALPAEPERRYLAPEQEAWLMQFVAKDFLNLANFGQFGESGGSTSAYGQSIDSSSFHTNPVSEGGAVSNVGSQRTVGDAGGGAANSSTASDDHQWIKVVTLEQLSVAATTLYFTFTQLDEAGYRQRHSFAVVITTPNTLGHKVSLTSLCDRLTHMHARVMSIFFGEDGDYYSNTPTTSTAADLSPGMDSMGRGTDEEVSFGHLGANTEALGPGTNLYPVATGGDELMQYDTFDESQGYNDIWRRELEAAVFDATLWVNGIVDRHRIPLKRTLIDELRRSATQTQEKAKRTIDWFEQIMSLALSEHRLIITGDKATVEQLLHTIALFMPDDRLFMASTQCFTNFIVPDLSFQGTTLPINKIKPRLVWFRYPVAIVDVSKQAAIDKPVHFLPARESGKKVYAVFREWRKEQIGCRRTLPLGKFMHSSLPPNRVVSPLVQVITRRFLCFIGGNYMPSTKSMPQTIGQPMANLTADSTLNTARGNASIVAAQHTSALASVSYTTPILNNAGAPANQSSALLSTTVVAGGSLSSTSNMMSPFSMNQNNSITYQPNRRPLLGEETGVLAEGPGQGYPRQFYDCLMFMLQQWRRTLTQRALAFYQSEVQMSREERDKPAALRTSDGDLHLLLATVEQIYPVGAALEEKASQLLVSNFLF